MTKPEILELIESSDLPGSVKRYCANILGGGLRSSLKTALKKNAGAVIGNMERLLAAASPILARSKEELLFATGFNKHNTSPERFEAALAEIRAAVFLHEAGFSGLELIGTGIKKTADIRGVRDGKKYVFEVCCLQTANELASVDYLIDDFGTPVKSGKKPVDYLELKYDKKVRQVNSSRKEYGCAGGGLIFVVNAINFRRFTDGSDLEELARELYARKNEPPFTHICILSGGFGCVFPEWEQAGESLAA